MRNSAAPPKTRRIPQYLNIVTTVQQNAGFLFYFIVVGMWIDVKLQVFCDFILNGGKFRG